METDELEMLKSALYLVGLCFIALGALFLKIAHIDRRIIDHSILWGGVMGIGILIIYKTYHME